MTTMARSQASDLTALRAGVLDLVATWRLCFLPWGVLCHLPTAAPWRARSGLPREARDSIQE
jgi:hypothetical protein